LKPTSPANSLPSRTMREKRKKFFFAVALIMLLPATASAQEGATELERLLEEAARKVSPAVVTVGSVMMIDLLKEHFYGERRLPRLQVEGIGSGVIIDPAGFVLTNEHVIADAKEVAVITADGEKYTNVRVVNSDPKTDLAVLKIEADREFPTVEWGEAERVRKGQFAIAFGNPLGFSTGQDCTMTFGIVSAVNRTLEQRDSSGKVTKRLENLIQTDAPISQGNSGGPLVDIHGRIIGINVAILTLTGGSEGIGFAIPFNKETKEIIARLKAQYDIAYGTIGVELKALSPDLARYLGIKPDMRGVFVSKVEEKGAAARAGMKYGDVILEFGGEAFGNPRALAKKIEKTAIGSKVPVKVFRNGKILTLEVEVERKRFTRKAEKIEEPRAWRGICVIDLKGGDERIKRKIPPDTKGVYIWKVEAGSAGARSGLRAGQIILEINHQPVTNVLEFRNLIKKIGKEDCLVHTDEGTVLLKCE